MAMTLSIISIVLAVACMAFAFHVSNVYAVFNRQIKDWAESLDDSMKQSLWLASRDLLMELSGKAERLKQEENNNNNNNTNEEDNE